MKHFICAVLFLISNPYLFAQTFEKDNFIYRINEDGTASWCGMVTIGNKNKDFLWKEGSNPVINVVGRKDDVKYEYKKFKKEIKIPESVKYEGKKYPITNISVDSNYFFRPLDVQKMSGAMPWLCQMSILIPPSITEIPECMWALHYEGLQIVFKNPQTRYIEEGHCMLDKDKNRIVAIDFYSMPKQLQIAREITLPASANSLSPYAMRGHILYSVKWPESITAIESETFKNCIFLKDFSIPGHIKSIGSSAFENAAGLGNVIIEEGVETIGKRAFYHSIVSQITMPNSCVSLEGEAFAECHSLKRIILSEQLTVIPEKAFMHTYSLDSLDIPSAVQEINPSAFYESRLFTATLPKDLRSIAPNTFSGCKALIKIILPSSLKSIGKQAFKDCINLSFLDIPASCEDIDNEAFSGTNIQLLRIRNPHTQLTSNALNNMKSLKYIDLDCQTTPEQAMPLIESIFNGHPSVCINLQQPAMPFRNKVKDSQWQSRLRNDSWHAKNSVNLFDFVDKKKVEQNNKNISDNLTEHIQEASRLCWCKNGEWESYNNYGGITLDEEGRPVIRVKGDTHGLQYLIEAIEHQLCGIGKYVINTGRYTYQPTVLFEDGIREYRTISHGSSPW